MGENESRKVFGSVVTALAASEATVIDARGMSQLTIITGSGATATYSRVDTHSASAHTTGTQNGDTVAATTKLVIPVDWPFYRISVAGGTCRIGLV